MARPFLTGVLIEQTATNRRNLSRVQAGSLAFHLAVLGLLLLIAAMQIHELPPFRPIGVFTFPGLAPAERVVKQESRGGGGGGNRNPIPWTRGHLPPFVRIQLVPAAPVRNPQATLIVPPTLVGPPELRLPNLPADNYGDPKQKLFAPSQGPGEGDGHGDKCCGAIGPGKGLGYDDGLDWGTGGGRPPEGTHGTSRVVCEYCPNPAYTEEARKVKFNGSVVLRVVIGVDGRAANIRLVKGAGLGLDERAIDAVSRWKFRASRGPDGRPVETWTEIEINFRIY
jgi:TonB family protein